MTTQLGSFCNRFPVYITSARHDFNNSRIVINYINNGTGNISLIPVLNSTSQNSSYNEYNINNKQGPTTNFSTGSGSYNFILTSVENNNLLSGFSFGYVISVYMRNLDGVNTNTIPVRQ